MYSGMVSTWHWMPTMPQVISQKQEKGKYNITIIYMSKWSELENYEKRGKWKNLEETKGTLFLFRHHDGSYVTGRHQKYVEIKRNPLGEDVIVLEDAQGNKSLPRPLSDFDVSLPPFEKETLQQEYERAKLKPEADGSVHFINDLPPFKKWKRLKEVGLMGGGGARKRKTRKKPKRKIKKRKTKKRKIKKRKARKRKTRKRFRNRRRKR